MQAVVSLQKWAKSEKASLETIELFENEGLERQSQKSKVRQRSMDEEIKEIRNYFAEFLDKRHALARNLNTKTEKRTRDLLQNDSVTQ